MSFPASTVITPPTTEPLTLTEVKSHLNLSSSDTSHDAELMLLLQAAREQWEIDTSYLSGSRTLQFKTDEWPDKDDRFLERPIQSITSIQYYDGDNILQTLSTNVYALNNASRRLELKYNQTWPAVITRWDAITVTYVAGETLATAAPKAAMLRMVGYLFEHRGDDDRDSDLATYRKMVNRFLRSTYP